MTPPRTPVPGDTDRAVIRAGAADLDVLSQVIAEAFHDLAPSRWLIPDPDARRQVFPGYFRLHLDHALAQGVVHTTPGRTAAALWIPAGEDAAAPPDGHGARLAAVTGPWASRFAGFDAALDRHHPAGTAHWHLAILAVRPDRQGRGTGAALLAACHAVLDQVPGPPAYLEASSSRARDLYLAHGYTLRPGAPFHLPGDGPPLWPMWRQPGARANAAASPAARERHPDAPAARERM
jgi:GNAT superfamily N-acetyltransferase